MLFVFGKKAKQLRLNKISELIHKSEAYMDLPMCRVSVHFVEIYDKVGTHPALLNRGYTVYFVRGSGSTQAATCTCPHKHVALAQDLEGDDYEVVPGSELEVSRTATKDNQSDYYINGRKSNFTNVTTLLKDKGIDLDHNRFLILQGEVEQISLMPPV